MSDDKSKTVATSPVVSRTFCREEIRGHSAIRPTSPTTTTTLTDPERCQELHLGQAEPLPVIRIIEYFMAASTQPRCAGRATLSQGVPLFVPGNSFPSSVIVAIPAPLSESK
jgi:hypothetical protein